MNNRTSLMLSASVVMLFMVVEANKASAVCELGAPDGTVSPSEDCDDNNLVDGDGCSSLCEIDVQFSCARTLDFASLITEDYAGTTANWVVAPDNLSGRQTVNSTRPTFALFGEDAKKGTYSTVWEVQTTADNDWLGLALGFSPGDSAAATADYLLIEWKQGPQNNTLEGMFLKHVLGARNESTHISHTVPQNDCSAPGSAGPPSVGPCVKELTSANTLSATGWDDNTAYDVHATYNDNRLLVMVDGVIQFDVSPSDFPGEFIGDVFPDGEIALYTLSQADVSYTNLAPFGPSICNTTELADASVSTVVGTGSTTIDIATLFSDVDDNLVLASVTVSSQAAGAVAIGPADGAPAGSIVLTPNDDSVPGLYEITYTACDDHPTVPHCETATISVQYGLDPDGDGQINQDDLDDDNDGILDTDEGNGLVDSDGDGVFDSSDLDSDDDGILDLVEAGHDGTDADGDGRVDGPHGDNGFADELETTPGSNLPDYDNDGDGPDDVLDTDGDGVDDFRDLDSDGDGITDVAEAGHDGVDGDGDGRVDGPVGENGIVDVLETAVDSGTVDYDGDGAGPDAPVDSDGDTVPDGLDLDSDNDGINDVVEAGGTDGDGDGLQDAFDAIDDSDGDGLIDSVDGDEGGTSLPVPDSDADGVVDALDLDSDNDSISDLIEGGSNGADANGDGVVDGPDSDGDGIADSVDGRVGHGDASSPTLPDDDDGTNPNTPNYLDVDSDNDGEFDIDEVNNGELDSNDDGAIDDDTDVDGDGIADVLDDSDGDGIPDASDPNPGSFGGLPAPDHDGDGVPDHLDLDVDNDGIPNLVEGAGDTDGDGVPDFRDLDSDNDGILDIIEVDLGALDSDRDGQVDGDVGNNGLADAAETAADSAIWDADGDGAGPDLPRNSDGDAQPDFQDLDSDNDSISDLVESGGDSASIDTDNDGEVDDGIDSDGDGIQDLVDGDQASVGDDDTGFILPNQDGGDPDYIDVDSDGDGIFDINEVGQGALDPNNDGEIDDIVDLDGDGIVDVLDDSDLDGIADVDDSDPQVFGGLPAPDTDGDGVPNSVDLDDDNDGIPDAIEGNVDTDLDGIPDSVDLDSDNDGIVDAVESGYGCTDIAPADGICDGPFGANGLADDVETGIESGETAAILNTDNSDAADFRDLDSDDDGLTDVEEAGGAAFDSDDDGVVDSEVDLDGDGIVDTADADDSERGFPGINAAAQDNDGDGIPSAYDADDDGPGPGDHNDDGFGDNVQCPNPPGWPSCPDDDGDGTPNYAEVEEADNDGVANQSDLDNDNDGIPDTLENSLGIDPDGDADDDGVPNYLDADNRGDGQPNDCLDTLAVGTCDTLAPLFDEDGDGIANQLDLDSDNDGIPDIVEAGHGGTDANGDGMVDGPHGANGLADSLETSPESGTEAYVPLDTDGDGTPDFLDLDSDNDGEFDIAEVGALADFDVDGDGRIDDATDVDGDGLMSVVDADDGIYGFPSAATDPSADESDGDGIPDAYDNNDNDADTVGDFDGDQIPDHIECPGLWPCPDSDNDGVPDYAEENDADNDGVGDGDDLDDDNDGIPDALETLGISPVGDDDGDSVPNYLDPDAGLCEDIDDDGVCDALASDFDFDGDGVPNHLDLDADGDGIFDAEESGFDGTDNNGDGILDCSDGVGANGLCDEVESGPDSGTTATPLDTDDDGASDFLDLDSDGDTISDSDEASPSPLDPPDTDGDGTPDYRDTDSDGDGIPDDREAGDDLLDTEPVDTDGDGVPDYRDLDSDGDGIEDEDEGDVDTDGDDIPDFQDTDSSGDGIGDGFYASGGGCQVGSHNSTKFPWTLILALGLLVGVRRRKRAVASAPKSGVTR